MSTIDELRTVFFRASDAELLAANQYGYYSPERIAATVVRESAERDYFREIDKPIGIEVACRRNRR